MNYSTYLKIDELLAIQVPRSEPEEHDEMLFIIIHQVHELWFKLLLHEIDKIRRDLTADDLFGAVATLKRARTVMKTLVAQLDILETMTPMSFSAFRDRLDTASGFQSVQFRELEFILGYRRKELVDRFEPEQRRVLEKRLAERSLVDHFHDFLEHRGVSIPEEVRNKPREESTRPDAAVQAGILDLYHRQKDVAILFELMTDFDEGMQEWRYRHVKMVERTIGNKTGTGGSLGVEFLKRTLFAPLFPDLWAVRHQF